MNRRSLLAALAMPMLVPSGTVSKAALAAAAASLEGAASGPETYPVSVGRSAHSEIAARLYRRESVMERASRGWLPPHIREKRSWSASYKAHVADQENEESYRITALLQDEGPLGIAFRAALGLGLAP